MENEFVSELELKEGEKEKVGERTKEKGDKGVGF